MRAFIGTAALALLLAGCDDKNEGAATGNGAGGGGAVAVQPAGGDWAQTVAATPDGGFVMGNPNAPVKLVEYASLTCPHCAAFSQEASRPLVDDYVKTGRVSYEFRNFVLNGADIAASLLARCQGPAPFFQLAEQLYETQAQWLDSFQKIPPAEMQRIGTLPQDQQVAAAAAAARLDQFFTARGLPADKARAGLADQAQVARLVDIAKVGQERDGVTGTPTFLINGKVIETNANWAGVKSALDAALG